MTSNKTIDLDTSVMPIKILFLWRSLEKKNALALCIGVLARQLAERKDVYIEAYMIGL